MKSLAVASAEAVQFEGGKVGYGGRTRYGGSVWDYAIRLSKRAASYVRQESLLFWWDCGSEGCIVDVKGVIFNPSDWTVIPLDGLRDIGIRTGHLPYLGTVSEKKWKLVSANEQKLIEKVPTNTPKVLVLGEEYRSDNPQAIPFPYLDLWN